MRLLLKSKSFILIGVLFFSQFSGVYSLIADPIFDTDDVFEVSQPGPNVKVSGNVDIKWSSYDDDSTFVPYTISLLDQFTCKNTITSLGSGNGLSDKSHLNSVTFDSKVIQNENELEDGKYCIKVCAAYQKDNANYSACNSRIVSIVNINKLAVIDSEPEVEPIVDGEYWEYEMDVIDPDNDDLSFYLLYGPRFLKMDQATGILSTIDDYQAVPAGYLNTIYRVVVGVDDGVSGMTTQEFQLKFVASGEIPDDDDDEIEDVNSPSIISFLNPTETEVIAGDYLFEWDITDDEGVEEIVVSLLNADGDLQSIVYTGPEVDSFEYDTTQIPDAEYVLQIAVRDSEGIEVSKLSKQFSVKNIVDPTINEPLIINIFPGDGTVVTIKRPTIYGEFATVPETTIDPKSLVVKLDGIDITDSCISNELSFECTLTEDLSADEHKIEISISDSDENIGTAESQFKVAEDVVVSGPVSFAEDLVLFGYTITREVILLLLLICCILLILMVIPWVLIRIWRRRERTVTNTVDTSVTATPTASFEDYLKNNAVTMPVNPNANYLQPKEPTYKDVDFYVPTPEQLEVKSEPVVEYKPMPEEAPVVEPVAPAPAAQTSTSTSTTTTSVPLQVQPEPVVVEPPPVEQMVPMQPQAVEPTPTEPEIVEPQPTDVPVTPEFQVQQQPSQPEVYPTEPVNKFANFSTEPIKSETQIVEPKPVDVPAVAEPQISEPETPLTPEFDPRSPMMQQPETVAPVTPAAPVVPDEDPFAKYIQSGTTSPIPSDVPAQDKSTYVEPTITDNAVDLSHMDSAKLDSKDNSQPEKPVDQNTNNS